MCDPPLWELQPMIVLRYHLHPPSACLGSCVWVRSCCAYTFVGACSSSRVGAREVGTFLGLGNSIATRSCLGAASRVLQQQLFGCVRCRREVSAHNKGPSLCSHGRVCRHAVCALVIAARDLSCVTQPIWLNATIAASTPVHAQPWWQ